MFLFIFSELFNSQIYVLSCVYILWVHFRRKELWQSASLSNLWNHGCIIVISAYAYNSPPLSKNAVSAFQISSKLLCFTLKDSWRNYIADDQYSSITEGSIYYFKHTYHSSGLTRNCMFNGNIYYGLYLQILRFYLVWQKSRNIEQT